MKHLLLFTIGPVQSFIAQARKVQDLAAGSKLLSELIAVAMDYAKKNAKAEIIFPHEIENADYPNRFIAYIENDNPQQLGEKLEQYVKKHFIDTAENLFKYIFTDKNVFDKAIEQLKDILKIYWVILPDVDKKNYAKDYPKIERLLGGVKNLRKFEQFAETGRKCSVNGEYNVVIYRKKTPDDKPAWLKYTQPVQIIEANDNKAIGLKHLTHGEGLSAISFFKRLYKEGENKFNATCEISYKFALDKLNGNDSAFYNAVKELKKIDEQYLYKDAGITEKDNQQTTTIHKLQDKINQKLRENKLKLGKYYAVLVFDADHMGEWLSGKHTNTDLIKFQEKISEKLGKFAQTAKGLVEKHSHERGQTIYAGGDDYIGLIPLEYLFGVLKDLREKFKIEVSDTLKDYKKDINKEFTFSAGIVIAHYKTPLGYVLNEARAAEHTAKEETDRNAVAFTVLKRSGEIHKAYFKWYDNDNNFLPDALFEIISALSNKESSNKFITNFTREFMPVMENFGNKDILKAELERLLRKNEATELVDSVNLLLEYYYDTKQDKNSLKNFIYLLNIADFIGRQINPIFKLSEKLKKKIITKLKADYKPEKIILFGSQAIGTAEKDSDIDLLIVKETDIPYHERATKVRKLLREISSALDIIVVSPQEFEKSKKDKYDIVAVAHKEGRIL